MKNSNSNKRVRGWPPGPSFTRPTSARYRTVPCRQGDYWAGRHISSVSIVNCYGFWLVGHKFNRRLLFYGPFSGLAEHGVNGGAHCQRTHNR